MSSFNKKKGNSIFLAISFALIVAAPSHSMSDADRSNAIQEKSAVWMRQSKSAETLASTGKMKEAAEIYRQIVSERKELGLRPSNERIELAKLLSKDPQSKSEAETIYKSMISETESEFGADDFCMSFPLGLYADFLKAEKRTDEESKIRERMAFVEKNAKSMPEKDVNGILNQSKLSAEQKSDKLLELGKLYIKRNRDDRAIFCLNACLRQNPKNAEALSERGEANARLAKDAAAKKDYDASIKLDPKVASTFFRRAIWYQNKGNLKLALQDFNESIKLNSKDIEALGYRAKLLSRLGNNKSALADYDAAISVDSSRGWPYLQRGQLYIDMGQFETGIKDLSTLVDRYPRNTDYLEFRGSAYEKAGHVKEALNDYDAIIKLNPDLTGIKKRRDELAAKVKKAASH